MGSVLYFGGEKTVFLHQTLRTRFWLFLISLFLKEFPQAFLRAKIIVSPFYSLLNGVSLRYVGLTIRVLNQFFWLGWLAQFLPPHEHVLDKVVENPVKQKKK